MPVRKKAGSRAGKRVTNSRRLALRPGTGNPHWGRAIVTESTPFALTPAGDPDITVSATPGGQQEGVKVSLGDFKPDANGPSVYVEIAFECPMLGRQRISGPLTVRQVYSLEEAVRAVFEAARARGILPSEEARGAA